ETVVSGRRFSIEPSSTTIGANVDATTYDALPVGRDYRSVVAFLPHANTSYYTGDPVNIGGATGLENAYFIDGVNVTDDHFQGVVSTFVLPYNFVRTESGDHSLDRKSTRLNSSHVAISYAVFCLKKKKTVPSYIRQQWR